MSALWHGNKAEEPVGDSGRPGPLLSGSFFSAEPNDFYLGFPHLGRSRPEANQKWPNWKGMRAFAFIKPAFSLFGATAWAQVMYNSFTIIFPLTHPEWGVGDELWLMEMETKWPFNLFFFQFLIPGFLLVRGVQSQAPWMEGRVWKHLDSGERCPERGNNKILLQWRIVKRSADGSTAVESWGWFQWCWLRVCYIYTFSHTHTDMYL